MSQISVQEEKRDVVEPKRIDKTPKEAKTKITDELLERALNVRADSSEIKALVERISKGPVLTKENRVIEIVQHNSGAINRIIKELNLKGKVKAKSCEKGKAIPTMIWRSS
ncbi:MAG TPA: hypothetical protein VNE86_04150 [Nitrososphaerales archaeon]|nr:hypothetical protein [Nitrososphaerales archaeon]